MDQKVSYGFLCGDVNAGDAESCPGPTQTRLMSFDAKSMQGALGGSDPPQKWRHKPTEEVLEDILETLEGIDRRLTGIDNIK